MIYFPPRRGMAGFVSDKAVMRTYLDNGFQIPSIPPDQRVTGQRATFGGLVKGGKGGFIGEAAS